MAMRSLARNGATLLAMMVVLSNFATCPGHGTVVYPKSRVRHVYDANPSNPSFPLAANAVAIDGPLSYYTWNEVSRNIPAAVIAGLPPAFDYSPFIPDGQLASAGRVDPNSPEYPRTYAGLDQVSADWPKTPLVAGSTITVQFLVTAAHSPSVWDVWMTKSTWNPTLPLTWSQMEYLTRPTVSQNGSMYSFDVSIPTDRSGHHVLWVAWQRNDPAGEVFVSTSDIDILPPSPSYPGTGDDLILATGANGTLSSTPPGDIQSVSIGNLWTVELRSPLGTLDGRPELLLAAPLGAAQAPVPVLGLPDVYIDPVLGISLSSGNGLSASGEAFSVTLPAVLVGYRFVFQGAAFAPSVLNGLYATTNAHVLHVVP